MSKNIFRLKKENAKILDLEVDPIVVIFGSGAIAIQNVHHKKAGQHTVMLTDSEKEHKIGLDPHPNMSREKQSEAVHLVFTNKRSVDALIDCLNLLLVNWD